MIIHCKRMGDEQLTLHRSFLIFLLAGGTITLLSQGALVVMLVWLPVGAATLISQLLHAFSGYWSSRWGAFQRPGQPVQYALVALSSWLLQWQIIKILLTAGYSDGVAVVLVLPALALWSFVLQRRFVFR